MCRTLIIFYILFRPGHLLCVGCLFFLMQNSGQDAYLGTPFICYRRVSTLFPNRLVVSDDNGGLLLLLRGQRLPHARN